MAQIHRQYAQDEIKNCSADHFYGFLKNEMTKLPQILPHVFKSFQILAGDGKSVGTVRLSKTTMGSSHEETVKDKIAAMDDQNRTLTVSVIDGALLRMYTKFEYTVTVTPLVTQGAEQSCIVKMFVEYEKRMKMSLTIRRSTWRWQLRLIKPLLATSPTRTNLCTQSAGCTNDA